MMMTMWTIIVALLYLVGSTAAYNITIGAVLAYNSGRSTDVNNERYLANMQQALADINSGYIQLDPPLPPGVNITIAYATSKSTATGAYNAAQYVLSRGAVAILGPFLSEESTPVATLGSALNIPIFSPTVSLSELSDKTRYPYFIRGRPVDISVGPPLIAFFRRNQWKRVCYLATNEVYGRSLGTWLSTYSLSGEISIQTQYFDAVATASVVANSAEEKTNLLVKADCRIIVMHSLSSYAGPALIGIARTGILDNPKYTVVGTVEWPPSASSFANQTRQIRGITGVIQQIPNNTLWNTWIQRMPQLWPDNTRFKWNTSPIAILESGWYDGIWIYAQAIANLLYVNLTINGPNILAAVQGLNNRFNGVSGPWSWDSNYDRAGFFDMFNFQNNSNTLVTRMGYYDPGVNASSGAIGTFVDYGKTWVFAGGAAKIARDGQSVLIGDELVVKTNGSIVTLAFVIGLVACWSALILIEQVIYAAEKQQRWWVWACACALVQGGPGVWALHMIAMCGMSWPAPDDLYFNPAWAAGSFVITVIINLLAFYSGLYGWQANKAWVDKGSSHHTSAAPATGKAAATAINNGSVGSTAITAGNKSRKYEPETTQGSVSGDGSTMNTNIPVTSGTRRRRRILQMSADHTVWGQLKAIPYRVNIWFALGALLLSATTMLSHYMIGRSLPSQYGTHLNSVPIILFFLFGTPCFMFSILLTFYFFPTFGVRFMAAVMMHIVNFISHIVANQGYSFVYSANTDGNTDYWWDPTIIVLAVAITTAALCFVLLAINVDRMKLSRNALDLVVVRFKKELASTISQVNIANEKELAQRKEKEKLWRMLETINLCRPMHRDHALSIALADYEAEVATLPALAAAVNGKTGATTPSHNDETKIMEGDDLKAPKIRAASALSVYQQLCSTIQLNGPTPDAVARDVKLEQLLRHPVTLELFKDSMIKDHNAENLMLYLDIRRYKVTADPQLRAVLSREIFDSFIARGARYEVNVSDTMRKQLEAKFAYRPGVLSPASEDYTATPADMFQPIEEELMKLIQVNNMPRFVGTPTFNLCAMILGRPQFRLKQPSAMAQTPASRGRGVTAAPGSSDSPKNINASAAAANNAFEGSDNEHSSRGGGRHRGNRGVGAGRGSAVTNASAFAGPIGVDQTALHVNHAKNLDEPSVDGREFSAGANGALLGGTPQSNNGPRLSGNGGSPHNERRPLLASSGSVPDLSSPTAVNSHRSPMGTPVVAMSTLADRNGVTASPLPPPSSRVPNGASDVTIHVRSGGGDLAHQSSHGSARGLAATMNGNSPNNGTRPSLPGTPTNGGIGSKPRVASLPGSVDGNSDRSPDQ